MKLENLSKQELINWAKEVRQACLEENDTSAVLNIDNAIESYESEKFVLSVMGLAKRGKSTLINALLGRKDDTLAPIDYFPATSVCTTFNYAEKEKIEVINRSGNVKQISADEIRNYATEEGNPENCKEVQLIRVASPFLEKFKGVTLVDLPGAGSIHEHHDQIIYQFIPQSTAVLLLTTARMPISADEIDLLSEVQKNDIGKIFVAMNKIDKTDDEDLSVGEEANRRALSSVNIPVNTIYRISAKRAFEGDWENSGVPVLMRSVLEFIDRNRGEFVKKRFIASVKSAGEKVRRSVETEAAISDLPPEKLAAMEAEFEEKKREFEEANKIRRKDFKLRWEGIIDEFASSLPQIKTKVQVALTNKMDSYGIASVGKFKKELPGFFAKTLDRELSVATQSMEERLQDLTKKYDEECPCICVSQDGTISSYQNVSHVAQGVLAGTGATLAVGGGLFSTIAGGLTTTVVTTSPWAAPFIAAGTTLGGLAGGSTSVAVGGAAVTTGILDTLLASAGAAVANTATSLGVTSTTVPTALAMVAGPIGWSVAAAGLCAIPVAWGFKRHKDLKNMKKTAFEKIEVLFSGIEAKQIPSLKDMGTRVSAQLEDAWQQQIVSMEAAMKRAAMQKHDANIRQRSGRFSALLG